MLPGPGIPPSPVWWDAAPQFEPFAVYLLLLLVCLWGSVEAEEPSISLSIIDFHSPAVARGSSCLIRKERESVAAQQRCSASPPSNLEKSLLLLILAYDELRLLLQVTFRDQPLSDYLLSREAAGPPPQACSEDHADAELRQAASPPEPELTGLYFLSAHTFSPHTSCRPHLLLNRQRPLTRFLLSVNNSWAATHVCAPPRTPADYRFQKNEEGFFCFFRGRHSQAY